jgi:spermidine/putrescine transport system permease protein
MGERRIVWQGQITSRGHLRAAAALLASPALIWLLVLVVLPGLGLGALGLMTRTTEGGIEPTLTLENMRRVIGLTDQGFEPDNLRILARTTLAAAVTSAAALLLGFPAALWIASRPVRWRGTLLALVTIPLCTNIVVRSYAWMLLLGPGSPLARFAGWLGMIGSGGSLYPSAFAVYLGMIAAALPFAVLSLYSSAERLDWSLIDAAKDLHGSRWRVMLHGLFAQAYPGIAAAIVLTFIPAMGMFVIPDLLGGAKYWMVGNLVQQQFGASRNWPYGAALSLVLLLLTIPAVLFLTRVRHRTADNGGGVPRVPKLCGAVTVAAATLLYLPLLSVLAASFFSTKTGLRFGDPTLVWYRALWKDTRQWEVVANTLKLAGISTVTSTLLGTMLALSLEHYPWSRRLRTAVDASLQIPVVMPDVLFAIGVVMALGVLRRWSDLFEPGMLSMVLGHVSFQVAFVTLVVRARLASVGTQYQQAAVDLYASRFTLLRRVTLPLLMPGVVSGALMAFTLSLDDFVISFMTGSSRSTTLPVYLYAAVRRGLSPEIHAMSAVMLAATVVLTFVSHWLGRRSTISA